MPLSSPHFIKSTPAISLNVGNCVIDSTSSVRNLGSIWDQTMSMDDFVRNKCTSILVQLRKLNRIKQYLSLSARKSLCQALIISRIDYCSSLLLNTTRRNVSHLQHLQNFAAWLIFDKTRRDPASPFLIKLHWLPVEQRIHFRILTYVYKCICGQAPYYLTELLTQQTFTRTTRYSSSYKLKEPFIYNKLSSKAFCNAGPKMWNKLPCDIKNATSLIFFKKLLKTHLFKLAYSL